MATETREKSLTLTDGRAINVAVTQLPATRGSLLLVRLAKLLGNGADGLGAFVPKPGQKPDPMQVGAAVLRLLSGVDEKEVEAIMRELIGTATMQVGEAVVPLSKVFDLEFAGQMGAIVDLLAFTLEVNYGSFFAGLAARGASAPSAKTAA